MPSIRRLFFSNPDTQMTDEPVFCMNVQLCRKPYVTGTISRAILSRLEACQDKKKRKLLFSIIFSTWLKQNRCWKKKGGGNKSVTGPHNIEWH